MNDRLVVQDGFLKPPNTPEAPRVRKWSRSVAVAVTVTFMSLTMSPPGSNFAEDQGSDASSSDDTGVEVGSWLLTVPYCAAKTGLAVAGSVVGGLGYAFSGGNSKTAETIWTTSVYGTYPPTSPSSRRGTDPFPRQGER